MAMIYLVEVNTSKDVRMFRAASKEAAVAIVLKQFDKDGLAATVMTCSDDLEGGKLMPILSMSVPQLSTEKK